MKTTRINRDIRQVVAVWIFDNVITEGDFDRNSE